MRATKHTAVALALATAVVGAVTTAGVQVAQAKSATPMAAPASAKAKPTPAKKYVVPVFSTATGSRTIQVLRSGSPIGRACLGEVAGPAGTKREVVPSWYQGKARSGYVAVSDFRASKVWCLNQTPRPARPISTVPSLRTFTSLGYTPVYNSDRITCVARNITASDWLGASRSWKRVIVRPNPDPRLRYHNLRNAPLFSGYIPLEYITSGRIRCDAHI